MLGKSCPWSTRIQLTQQSQPLSLDDTGGVFAFAFGTRWCAVSGSSTFPLLDRPALQIGRRVQWSSRSSKKNFNTIWHWYTASVVDQILRWHRDE